MHPSCHPYTSGVENGSSPSASEQYVIPDGESDDDDLSEGVLSQFDIDFLAITLSCDTISSLFPDDCVGLCKTWPKHNDTGFAPDALVVTSFPFILKIKSHLYDCAELKIALAAKLHQLFFISVCTSPSYVETTQRSRFNTSFITGTQFMALPDLCTAIKALGISKIRLVQFGQKSKLKNFRNFPFRLALPSSEDNGENDGPDIETYVDVGKFVQTESIALINWAPVSDNIQSHVGQLQGVKIFPVLGPVGDGAGWVQAKFRNTSFKVYPHLTHSVKAYNSSLGYSAPKSIKSLRGYSGVFLGMMKVMKASPLQLSHYRIEARLKVSSLSNLLSQVLELPIWSSNQLRHLGITIKSVPTALYFQQFDAALHNAGKNRLFQGDNGAKPRENQLVGLRSLLNLVGINKDYSRTHSMPFKSFFARYFGGFQFSIGDGGLGVYPDTNWGRLAKEDQGRERHGLPAIDHLFNPLSAESARVFRTRYIPHNVSLVHVNPSQGERYAETDAESDANPGPGPDTYWKVTRNNIRIRDYSISRPIIDIEPSPGIGETKPTLRIRLKCGQCKKTYRNEEVFNDLLAPLISVIRKIISQNLEDTFLPRIPNETYSAATRLHAPSTISFSLVNGASKNTSPPSHQASYSRSAFNDSEAEIVVDDNFVQLPNWICSDIEAESNLVVNNSFVQLPNSICSDIEAESFVQLPNSICSVGIDECVEESSEACVEFVDESSDEGVYPPHEQPAAPNREAHTSFITQFSVEAGTPFDSGMGMSAADSTFDSGMDALAVDESFELGMDDSGMDALAVDESFELGMDDSGMDALAVDESFELGMDDSGMDALAVDESFELGIEYLLDASLVTYYVVLYLCMPGLSRGGHRENFTDGGPTKYGGFGFFY
ncbi:hypothetical protein BC829DRAFT_445207 [Chytridium lagenaria]|nr:hypothetical protein BC829DRAFT_445207 [Chytridium lagenaria]